MKKNNLYILLFLSIIFPQSSSLGIYGFGEMVDSYDASSVGLGDSKFFSGNSTSFSISSPSSYWKSSLVKLFTTLQFSESDFASNDIQENHFQVFSFMFPVGNNRACAFGMNPLYRTNMQLVEEDLNFIGADSSPEGNPIAFRTTYDFSGGISEFFIAYSMKINSGLSFGVRLSKLFGNSNNRYVLSLNDVSFDDEGNIEFNVPPSGGPYISYGNYKNRYSGQSYNIEGRYTHNRIEVVLSYLETSSLKIKFTPEYDLVGYVNYSENNINSSIKQHGLGVKYLINDDFGIVFETHNTQSFKSFDFLNILKQNSPDVFSVHFGLFNKYHLKDKGILNEFNLRMGFYSKLFSINDLELSDLGLTIGFGFEFLDGKSSIDLSLLSGKREVDYAFNDEKYYKFIMSIASNEKWFQRKGNK